MEYLLQLFLSGLAIGGIYALVAIGFVLIYKATEVVNFAQGEMMMVGAYFCFTFRTILGLSLLWAVPLTIICSALLGIIIERLFLRPLLGKPTFTLVMVTIALAAALRASVGLIWSHDTHSFGALLPFSDIRIGSAVLSSTHFLIIVIAFLLSGLLFLFFRFTLMGTAMRAVASSPRSAQLMGISTERVFSLTWAMASAISSVGGILLANLTFLHPSMGFIGLKALPAAMLGGFESLSGALVGGIIIGLIENLSGVYLSKYFGGIKEVSAFIVLLIVLIIKPAGIFGAREEKRV